MKSRWHVATCLIVAASGLSPFSTTVGQEPTELLPLPQWTEGEEPEPLLGGLLPQAPQVYAPDAPPLDATAAGSQFLAEGPPRIYPEAPLGLSPGDMGLFLPESLLATTGDATPPLRPPTPAIAIENFPAEAFQAAANRATSQALIDALGLIPEMPTAGLKRFLEFHNREARIPISVVVMDRHHRLAESADLAAMASASDSGETALVAYPLGEPWRARIFLSRSIHAGVTPNYLAGMASDCIEDALEVSAPGDQLQRFLVRLSTRLFWLEGVLGPKKLDGPAQAQLHEIAHAPQPNSTQWLRNLASWVFRGFWILGALALGLTAGWLGLRKLRSRIEDRNRSSVWILPEPEIEPRLGGAFSGGTSASDVFQSSQPAR